jgi:hypothetical protein
MNSCSFELKVQSQDKANKYDLAKPARDHRNSPGSHRMIVASLC